MNLLAIQLLHLLSIILGAVYLIILVFTIVKILLDTHSTSKTLAYLLVVTALPLFGILLYFSFGINYRHRKSNKKTIDIYDTVTKELQTSIEDDTDSLIAENKKFFQQYTSLISFARNLGLENLSSNQFKLLINGEEKFPEVLKVLDSATKHIHMEYYAWENDVRGNQIKEILLKKAKSGVKVRIMYDAYASRKIKHNIVAELQNGGVEIQPVIKIRMARLANRVNHRDHRKIIIIDGIIGFLGGINISDRYDNSIDTGLYWRDTHIKITGPGVMNIQRHWIINWHACQQKKLEFNDDLLPARLVENKAEKTELSQITVGGPIYPMSTIMLTYAKMFSLAQKKLFITNPYFIPNQTILDVLKQAAKSGVDVRLMMPEKSDSAIVGAASKFYYKELLYAGVKIYMYKKGFVHAKTAVADGMVSIVGSANMDIRSFDLNFEIFTIVYGEHLAAELEEAFINDLKDCDELDYSSWIKQSKIKSLIYAIARLISSFL